MTILLYDLVGADHARPFSPHCWKTTMALAHKGLDFVRMPTPFTKIPSIADGMQKTVPVIDHDGVLVSDSFEIARFLETTYPDRASLFGGPGGEAAARFIERWTQLVVQAQLVHLIVKDVHDTLDDEDQAFFRKGREARLGKRLEDIMADRDAKLPVFRASLEPLRSMLSYQPFLGGSAPLFTDYIVFGAFQWARVVSSFEILAPEDAVAQWFARCLDLHYGIGNRVAAAA